MQRARFKLVAGPWFYVRAAQRWVRLMSGWAPCELGSVWADGRYVAAGGGRLGGQRLDAGARLELVVPTRGLKPLVDLCSWFDGRAALQRVVRLPGRAESAIAAKQLVDAHLRDLGFELMSPPTVRELDKGRLELLVKLAAIRPPPPVGEDLFAYGDALEQWGAELEAVADKLVQHATVEREGAFQPAKAGR